MCFANHFFGPCTYFPLSQFQVVDELDMEKQRGELYWILYKPSTRTKYYLVMKNHFLTWPPNMSSGSKLHILSMTLLAGISQLNNSRVPWRGWKEMILHLEHIQEHILNMTKITKSGYFNEHLDVPNENTNNWQHLIVQLFCASYFFANFLRTGIFK